MGSDVSQQDILHVTIWILEDTVDIFFDSTIESIVCSSIIQGLASVYVNIKVESCTL